MSNWFYVGLAYGVTYVTLLVYTVSIIRRRARAEEALRAEAHHKAGAV
jgi:CcmD family protein